MMGMHVSMSRPSLSHTHTISPDFRLYECVVYFLVLYSVVRVRVIIAVGFLDFWFFTEDCCESSFRTCLPTCIIQRYSEHNCPPTPNAYRLNQDRTRLPLLQSSLSACFSPPNAPYALFSALSLSLTSLPKSKKMFKLQ